MIKDIVVMSATDQFSLDAAERIGALVERYGFAVITALFLFYVLYRVFFDYIKELKDAVARAEAGRERAEVERDEAQSAFQALVNDINTERKEVLESLTGMVSKIKKDSDDRGG
ncbi:hypothetical protein [Paenibacillus hunanensis]|uniref:Methyl-accepting chemotaxis protein n=1 Tax=Paenibacillus hunanensis TaxID=539262 RepID=A0ABU1IXM8_9BACL|nr:hypothetical protein [Paenibacillus hunanensis]MDR6243132.1 methyl-accepting chemotaxis protein [Paenibacillus hunanensis]GGJ11578.1 hypothetical protein GCM10008022_20930 [Paenibacillus hunanensis]